MHGQNIIIIAQQNWDAIIGTNPRNMTKELARHNRLLYVNMTLNINTVIRKHQEPDAQQYLRVLLGKVQALIKVASNVWILTIRGILISANWLVSEGLFASINRFNAWLLAQSIRKAARAVGFHSYCLLQDGLSYPSFELRRSLEPIQFTTISVIV